MLKEIKTVRGFKSRAEAMGIAIAENCCASSKRTAEDGQALLCRYRRGTTAYDKDIEGDRAIKEQAYEYGYRKNRERVYVADRGGRGR